MKHFRTLLLFLVLMFLGFAWRIHLYQANPQELIYDQRQYYIFADTMLIHGLAGDTVRLYGYPLIILPIVKYFGASSPLPWVIFHTVLDMATACIVFVISKKIFSHQSTLIPWISFILYVFNPYTSAYVTVLLTEIFTIFLLTFCLWLIFKFLYHRKTEALFLIAFILGYIPQVRPSFYYWSLCLTGYILLLVIKSHIIIKQKIVTAVFIGILFCIPFIYTIASNLVIYHQFSVQSVDNIFLREMYISNFVGRGIPFANNPEWMWPPEAYEAWYEFSTPNNPTERKIMTKKYVDKNISVFKADIPKFITHHARKLWYVWEKHFLYPYTIGPDSPFIRFLVYWGNVLFLAIGWIGTIFYTFFDKTHADKNKYTIGIITLGLFMYISIAHVFSTTEERFSLPAYPMVAVFAGFTIIKLKQIISQKFIKQTE
jgi:hypothetical protein